MKYLIGVDVGTSATKTVLFDEECRPVAEASAEYPMYQPQNGWAEQNPKDWEEAAASTIREVMERSRVNKDDVVGLGLSGQMHGLVMLDKDNEVIRPAIIWCDQRTAAECEEITAKVGKERLIEITANPALTGFTASKILWVRNHEPKNYAACRHILLPKDYVRFAMTGEYATEVSDASGMQLLDVPHRCWSKEVLAKLDIDEALLPKVFESPEVTGHISTEFAQRAGLSEKCVVAGGAGDNAAAAVGTGIVEDGKAFTTIGTSGVVFAHSDTVQIDPAGRVHTFCSAVPGCYTVMSASLAAGLSLKWTRDTFFQAEIQVANDMGTDSYVLMNQEAAKSPIGANRLIYLPYLMGERSPILDPETRGVFFGLTAMHTKRDIVRAVMEGVIYSQWQNLNVLRGMHVAPDSMLACGGGAKSPFWRQMMADMFGMPVSTLQNTEGPALGAAILAGVGTGVFTDIPTACRSLLKEGEPLQPDMDRHNQYVPFFELYQSLYPALKDCFHRLNQL